MPIAKRPTKKALMNTNKCPWCGSKNFKKAEKVSLISRIRYIGCQIWVCGKCNKKWGT